MYGCFEEKRIESHPHSRANFLHHPMCRLDGAFPKPKPHQHLFRELSQIQPVQEWICCPSPMSQYPHTTSKKCKSFHFVVFAEYTTMRKGFSAMATRYLPSGDHDGKKYPSAFGIVETWRLAKSSTRILSGSPGFGK
jgi:hypothetical protein